MFNNDLEKMMADFTDKDICDNSDLGCEDIFEAFGLDKSEIGGTVSTNKSKGKREYKEDYYSANEKVELSLIINAGKLKGYRVKVVSFKEYNKANNFPEKASKFGMVPLLLVEDANGKELEEKQYLLWSFKNTNKFITPKASEDTVICKRCNCRIVTDDNISFLKGLEKDYILTDDLKEKVKALDENYHICNSCQCIEYNGKPKRIQKIRAELKEDRTKEWLEEQSMLKIEKREQEKKLPKCKCCNRVLDLTTENGKKLEKWCKKTYKDLTNGDLYCFTHLNRLIEQSEEK